MIKLHRPLLTLISVSALLAACESVPFKKTDHNTTTEANQSSSSSSSGNHHLSAPTKPEHYSSVWERMRAGYGLPEVNDSVVSTQLRWYSSNQSYLNRVANQSQPYLHYVVTEMEAKGIPLELALLPIVESNYDPNVKSPSSAAGIWQFVPQTGKNLGLKQNSWYDGRKDVVASTEAAIRYLKKLYSMFDNDWLLAIAAYNAGEGTVRVAIDKNKKMGKGTDFWSLPLAQQTQSYVPQLIALSKIIADPQRYNLALVPIPDDPYFVKINVESQINLAQAAKQADMNVDLLKKLNSGLNGWLTDPTASHELLVPVADAAAFTLQLDSLPKIPQTKWQEHVVVKGETLETLSKLYGVNTSSIKSINNLKNDSLRIGQRLQISTNNINPTATIVSNNSYTTEPEKIFTEIKKDNLNNSTYAVKSGENLWSIAKDKKMSVTTLAQLNGLSIKSTLQPGQKLIVSNQTSITENNNAKKITYTIKSGDTLNKIADKFNVSTREILAWNQVKDESAIYLNQELTIYLPIKN